MTEVVTVDIGGTHARFAVARLARGAPLELGPVVTLKTAEHGSLQLAWEAFARQSPAALPRAAAIAVAAPLGGEVLQLTNNPWVIRPGLVASKLNVDRFTLVNDFGAVAHALAHLDDAMLRHVCGPDTPLPDTGVITVVGPGTGLGVAFVQRSHGSARVVETEGGHMDFAPLDAIEDAVLRRLRPTHRRVSVERIVSGPGLAAVYGALAALEERSVEPRDDRALWTAALEGGDSLAAAALDRFCLSLGSAAGDLALAQGAGAVVIAGGLGLRLADHLPRSGFAERFRAKGRFQGRMAALPVKVMTHPNPGLIGAAAAFAAEHGVEAA